MTAYTPPKWEDVRDKIAGSESYDYDTIAWDRLDKDGSRRNLAGIVTPKPISQMQLGVLTDWQKNEMRNKSRAYGLTLPGRQEELRRQGFKGDPGSTGVGRYQFERSTLIDTAQDLYGDGWKDVVFTPDEQEKLAKHLYTRAAARGPEALGNTWHALRNVNMGPGAPANKDSGSTGAPLLAAAATPAVAAVGAPLATATALNTLRKVMRGNNQQQQQLDYDDNDIGTLRQYNRSGGGQYSGQSNQFLSNQFGKLRAQLKRKREQQQKELEMRQQAQGMAESVRFKDLRKKIYEQIIMNESLERGE